MSRFFVPASGWNAGGSVVLDEAEARHACEVMRLREGDALTVFDGAGREAKAVLRSVKRQGAEAEILESRMCPPPPVRLTLFQAVPKGKLFEWILEKATELGASRIVPLLTERTVVQLDAAEGGRKREKWQRTVLEACKQCGQNWMPEVAAPVSLAAALRESARMFAVVGSLYPGARGFAEVLPESAPKEAGIFIGPEGDFTQRELDELLEWGARPVTFGPIVLRAETAAIYGLSVLAHRLF